MTFDEAVSLHANRTSRDVPNFGRAEAKAMNDTIGCPNCGHKLTDLWDYTWEGDTIETECPECETSVAIYRYVDVTYRIVGKANNETEINHA